MEVKRYYFRARLLGSRLGLPCKNPPLGSESVPAPSSCMMWTVCMVTVTALDTGNYHANTGPLGPLMCSLQVRVPWGSCSILLLTLTLKHQFQSTKLAITSRPKKSSTISFVIYRYYISDSNHIKYEKKIK
jgi:hypothetical protein